MKPFVAIAVLLFLLAPLTGVAAIQTCVEVQTDKPEEMVALEKLVESEFKKHTTHQMAEEDCISTLTVEMFQLSQITYLTIRANKGVPVRYEIEDAPNLARRLATGMSLVLGNDPVHLSKNITEFSARERAAHSIHVSGTNIYRLELFESVTRTGEGASYAPGLAFAFTRGSGHWRVFGRFSVAVNLNAGQTEKLRQEAAAAMGGGVTYEFLRLRAVSPYISTGGAIGYQRFRHQRDTSNTASLQILGRMGVRMLRLTDYDLDIFTAGYLPLIPASSEDSFIFGADGKRWTPYLQLGIGVGF